MKTVQGLASLITQHKYFGADVHIANMQELKKSAEPYIFRSFRAELTDPHFFLGIVGSDYGLVSNIFFPLLFEQLFFGIQVVTETL